MWGTDGGTQGSQFSFAIAMGRAATRGAIFGLVAGLLALGGVLTLAWQCLPLRISFPPQPWPWYCSDPAYGLIGYLAFPVPLLTNDLAQAILLAPLSLLLYVVLGALIGSIIHSARLGS
jgi:hypothetical protein